MSLIEIIASVFGLICVWLTVRENIWCWPTGLVMIVLLFFVYYDQRLYSQMCLQVVYVFLQFYGWYEWKYGGDTGELPVTRMTPKAIALWSSIAITGALGLGTFMHLKFAADFPYIDATITVFSLIAQYLMARKLLECWLIWITVDVLSVGMYLAIPLYALAGLYTVFLVLATMGWFEWKKSFRKKNAEALQPA